jgi:transcription-repair coupling factor (superfamily II helicase)
LASTFASPFKPGQLVVHATHGVSRYAGTKMMEGADGKVEEYFQLDYADGHRVFVPIEHVARLSKHVGDEVALARLTTEVQPRSPYSRIPKPK